MKIKKGDQVKMLAGKDRGKIGKVLTIFPVEEKLTVEGLNLMKKHVRPKKEGEKGQIVEIPRRVDSSNVMVVCPKCGKNSRIGLRQSKSGKLRICKKCQTEL
ncbi:MAG: 50S ribosomal protein L24 [Candidatus Moranbacteria bacterium CG10_big_fil_rev_8_21_14_0_10_35_21]|nr:MAG: 50S ribosomal protein L24 [Candidatus Moranbacteria bacterium CG10_big_fil_rev_8_21_14_0_10_35_21]PJA88779.1 MAG: 50S ribosomal protein L24 [Candidatus Moranbacteria bacterium CG_4_9_14_3_um_filter_36_9]